MLVDTDIFYPVLSLLSSSSVPFLLHIQPPNIHVLPGLCMYFRRVAFRCQLAIISLCLLLLTWFGSAAIVYLYLDWGLLSQQSPKRFWAHQRPVLGNAHKLCPRSGEAWLKWWKSRLPYVFRAAEKPAQESCDSSHTTLLIPVRNPAVALWINWRF